MTPPIVFALAGNIQLAASIAGRLSGQIGSLERRSFPDGETYLRYRDELAGRAVVLVCSLDRPDEKFLPLVFAADAAKELGAASVTLVAPYLAYMRQDKRFQAGEAITSLSFARRLSTTFDSLVTVDPHLHRYKGLGDIYSIPTAIAHSAPVIAQWIADHVESPFIIGPDMESEQWVNEVAEISRSPYRVLQKQRRGDRDVRITVPDLGELQDRTPVLVDDIVSSGRTMLETAKLLGEKGLPQAVCIAVHVLLSDEAYGSLLNSVRTVASTNTIEHQSNQIDIAAVISEVTRTSLTDLDR